ncbi:hypothetical protein SmJEL517_g00990 [Synchytrium microbalum]|uniref:glutaminase n=1 Tax=Synchytrium microbalum TaxID=1806994 RepID=A0A507CGP3_9FUNG|nr:uncharacterized protein SmJEL517_g00990 [Synchytrium microbalum]TPX37216.1 hypothetical protein SmJEL517_g00990 [Synchytrium microbalum]
MGEVKPVRIGVLALQGAFAEHINLFNKLSTPAQPIQCIDIRTSTQLADTTLDALVLPGGESTTMAIVAEKSGLLDGLKSWSHQDVKPVWGTCAGMILLSNTALATKESGQPLIGGLDITIKRNAFGSQVDSFTADLDIGALSPEFTTPFPGVFIRAPVVESIVPAKGVDVLAKLDDGRIVAVRQGNIVATAFHPELTRDDRLHRYFIELVKESLDGKK